MLSNVWYFSLSVIQSRLFSFPQDTQEFLRCFMDQLHEELKHPIMPDVHDTEPEDMDCDESSHSAHQLSGEESREERVAVSAPIDVQGQSDTDYETCESGISSERSSVENSVSGDENIDNAYPKIADQNKTNNANVVLRSRKDKNYIPGDAESITSRPDSGISSLHSDSSLCQKTAKEIKDSVNIASQQLSNETSSSSPDTDSVRHVETECIEYTDAVAELEPLQGRKVKASPPSAAAQRLRHLSEPSTVGNRSSSPQSCLNVGGK